MYIYIYAHTQAAVLLLFQNLIVADKNDPSFARQCHRSEYIERNVNQCGLRPAIPASQTISNGTAS